MDPELMQAFKTNMGLSTVPSHVFMCFVVDIISVFASGQPLDELINTLVNESALVHKAIIAGLILDHSPEDLDPFRFPLARYATFLVDFLYDAVHSATTEEAFWQVDEQLKLLGAKVELKAHQDEQQILLTKLESVVAARVFQPDSLLIHSGRSSLEAARGDFLEGLDRLLQQILEWLIPSKAEFENTDLLISDTGHTHQSFIVQALVAHASSRFEAFRRALATNKVLDRPFSTASPRLAVPYKDPLWQLCRDLMNPELPFWHCGGDVCLDGTTPSFCQSLFDCAMAKLTACQDDTIGNDIATAAALMDQISAAQPRFASKGHSLLSALFSNVGSDCLQIRNHECSDEPTIFLQEQSNLINPEIKYLYPELSVLLPKELGNGSLQKFKLPDLSTDPRQVLTAANRMELLAMELSSFDEDLRFCRALIEGLGADQDVCFKPDTTSDDGVEVWFVRSKTLPVGLQHVTESTWVGLIKLPKVYALLAARTDILRLICHQATLQSDWELIDHLKALADAVKRAGAYTHIGLYWLNHIVATMLVLKAMGSSHTAGVYMPGGLRVFHSIKLVLQTTPKHPFPDAIFEALGRHVWDLLVLISEYEQNHMKLSQPLAAQAAVLFHTLTLNPHVFPAPADDTMTSCLLQLQQKLQSTGFDDISQAYYRKQSNPDVEHLKAYLQLMDRIRVERRMYREGTFVADVLDVAVAAEFLADPDRLHGTLVSEIKANFSTGFEGCGYHALNTTKPSKSRGKLEATELFGGGAGPDDVISVTACNLCGTKLDGGSEETVPATIADHIRSDTHQSNRSAYIQFLNDEKQAQELIVTSRNIAAEMTVQLERASEEEDWSQPWFEQHCGDVQQDDIASACHRIMARLNHWQSNKLWQEAQAQLPEELEQMSARCAKWKQSLLHAKQVLAPVFVPSFETSEPSQVGPVSIKETSKPAHETDSDITNLFLLEPLPDFDSNDFLA
eukprot:TRINITY_DN10351_c0_g1_i1.p1 TRINITY_DN10351_c0_g1~~TRINITY_DN10351_c0_g1_i1.p1  ORF type:complete len:1057 (+),score=171.19 TRINITY_DN10351_c0_g1_i1:283-3171(+)